MMRSGSAARAGSPMAILVLATFLVALLALVLPTTASAAAPAGTGSAAEVCAPCHAAESKAWGSSIHAKSGVSCEACHGAFVPEHPQKRGLMKLDIESASCRTCHSETYTQWRSSLHGKMGVQCIGCHLSHSQTFRLTDVNLCGSCHRQVAQDQSHTAHKTAGISCVQCHVASADPAKTPSHTFTGLAENCVDCHGKTIHEFVAEAKMAPPKAEDILSAKLAVCEETNNSLLPMTVVNLGLGLGVGGLAGVVFMLAISYIRERRAKQ